MCPGHADTISDERREYGHLGGIQNTVGVRGQKPELTIGAHEQGCLDRPAMISAGDQIKVANGKSELAQGFHFGDGNVDTVADAAHQCLIRTCPITIVGTASGSRPVPYRTIDRGLDESNLLSRRKPSGTFGKPVQC